MAAGRGLGFAVAAVALASGCAWMAGGTPELPADPRRGDAVDSLCFIRSINGYGEATDRTLVVRSGARDFYQLETVTACSGLKRAQSVAFNSATGCLVRGDKLFPFDNPVGRYAADPPAFGCIIGAIYRWRPDAAPPAAEPATDAPGR